MRYTWGMKTNRSNSRALVIAGKRLAAAAQYAAAAWSELAATEAEAQRAFLHARREQIAERNARHRG